MHQSVVVANGQDIALTLPCTLADFLEARQFAPRSVVVEHNGKPWHRRNSPNAPSRPATVSKSSKWLPVDKPPRHPVWGEVLPPNMPRKDRVEPI